MKIALAIAIVLGQGTCVLAADTSQICDTAALQAARSHGIPAQIMLAVTRVETGRNHAGRLSPWPWTLNNAGKAAWFDTPIDALDHAYSLIDAGQTNIDIGCFQLNLYWHGKGFASLEDMLDPQHNADYAAKFLLEKYNVKGNWVDAVAAYHSENFGNASNYVTKVEDILLTMQSQTQTDPLPQTGHKRQSSFPLLLPGTNGALASLVPLHENQARPLFTVAD